MKHRGLFWTSVALGFSLVAVGAASAAERGQGRPSANPALSALKPDSPARARGLGLSDEHWGAGRARLPPTNPGAANNLTRVDPRLLRHSRGVDGRPQRPATPDRGGELNGQLAF